MLSPTGKHQFMFTDDKLTGFLVIAVERTAIASHCTPSQTRNYLDISNSLKFPTERKGLQKGIRPSGNYSKKVRITCFEIDLHHVNSYLRPYIYNIRYGEVMDGDSD